MRTPIRTFTGLLIAACSVMLFLGIACVAAGEREAAIAVFVFTVPFAAIATLLDFELQQINRQARVLWHAPRNTRNRYTRPNP